MTATLQVSKTCAKSLLPNCSNCAVLQNEFYQVCAYSTATDRQKMQDRIIRVDHAGEYGADRIYAGQMAVLGTFHEKFAY